MKSCTSPPLEPSLRCRSVPIFPSCSIGCVFQTLWTNSGVRSCLQRSIFPSSPPLLKHAQMRLPCSSKSSWNAVPTLRWCFWTKMDFSAHVYDLAGAGGHEQISDHEVTDTCQSSSFNLLVRVWSVTHWPRELPGDIYTRLTVNPADAPSDFCGPLRSFLLSRHC